MRGLRSTVVTALAMVAVASCGLSDQQLKPTMTKDQAAQQVTSYDVQILTALLGKPQSSTKEPSSLGCETADIPGPKGRVELSTDSTVAADHPEGNPAIFQALKTEMSSLGFDQTGTMGTDLFFKNKSNGFTVMMEESSDASKTLTLSVASPCVWPNGTSGPGT
ncbi:hypothetical protein P3T35_007850 [Kitasatospora sp. GP30]|uniref:hypothetical protein n=1 Tax=Kitasatospora sp. GP30 TaxID=3035084 RepID=UPI000C70BEE8|nr:hypothetical protein [Kitasatospora sp. GP30]MDH6145789.1 hypothetical protein [Kitasatospora sp. GP30]